jgi:hypothetical protein
LLKLTAPERVVCAQPIPFSFEADQRVAGRVRLTRGTEELSFRLERDAERVSDPATGHRVRGRRGAFLIRDWGEHAVGEELVLRFEGAKVWMTVGE